jgi:hypothetical protein
MKELLVTYCVQFLDGKIAFRTRFVRTETPLLTAEFFQELMKKFLKEEEENYKEVSSLPKLEDSRTSLITPPIRVAIIFVKELDIPIERDEGDIEG